MPRTVPGTHSPVDVCLTNSAKEYWRLLRKVNQVGNDSLLSPPAQDGLKMSRAKEGTMSKHK